MKKRLFVSGSRYWNGNKHRIKQELMALKDRVGVLVGDCYGVDLAVQQVCKEEGIECFVFHIGNAPRNNMGFKAFKVPGSSYTDKDIMMSKLCDEALVFWNGTSKGSKANIDRVEAMGKPVKVVSDQR